MLDIHTPVKVTLKADRLHLTFVDDEHRKGFIAGIGGVQVFTEEDPYNEGQPCPRIEVGESSTISIPCFHESNDVLCIAFPSKSMMKAFVNLLEIQYKKSLSGQPLVTAKKGGAILMFHDPHYFRQPKVIQAINIEAFEFNDALREIVLDYAKDNNIQVDERLDEKAKLKKILTQILIMHKLVDKHHPPRITFL